MVSFSLRLQLLSGSSSLTSVLAFSVLAFRQRHTYARGPFFTFGVCCFSQWLLFCMCRCGAVLGMHCCRGVWNTPRFVGCPGVESVVCGMVVAACVSRDMGGVGRQQQMVSCSSQTRRLPDWRGCSAARLSKGKFAASAASQSECSRLLAVGPQCRGFGVGEVPDVHTAAVPHVAGRLCCCMPASALEQSRIGVDRVWWLHCTCLQACEALGQVALYYWTMLVSFGCVAGIQRPVG